MVKSDYLKSITALNPNFLRPGAASSLCLQLEPHQGERCRGVGEASLVPCWALGRMLGDREESRHLPGVAGWGAGGLTASDRLAQPCPGPTEQLQELRLGSRGFDWEAVLPINDYGYLQRDLLTAGRFPETPLQRGLQAFTHPFLPHSMLAKGFF